MRLKGLIIKIGERYHILDGERHNQWIEICAESGKDVVNDLAVGTEIQGWTRHRRGLLSFACIHPSTYLASPTSKADVRCPDARTVLDTEHGMDRWPHCGHYQIADYLAHNFLTWKRVETLEPYDLASTTAGRQD
jgi:hypothetical protein